MDEPELGWADESGPPASPLLASIAREFLPHGVVYGLNDLETHVLLADHHVFWPIETEDA